MYVALTQMLLYTIQINQPTSCNSFTSLLLDVYVWLNIFRAPLFHHQERTTALGASGFTVGEGRVGALLVVVWQDNLPDHDQ
jgi:hypothetical protein